MVLGMSAQMASGTIETIGAEDLERSIAAIDRAIVFVSPRVLRRIIRRDLELDLFGWRVSHRKSHVIPAREARRIADPDELGLSGTRADELPKTLILLARPDPDTLTSTTVQELLVEYWRLVFHAQVRIAVSRRIAEHSLKQSDLRARIDRIGQSDFDEVRAVLSQEGLVDDPRDLFAVYTEFAALYLELRHFEPRLLRAHFPALIDHAAIDEVLAMDVKGQELLEASRPAGAAAPTPSPEPQPEEWAGNNHEEIDLLEPELWFDDERGRFRWRIQKSEKLAKLGNVVRAAILKMKASREAPQGKEEATRAAAVRTLKRMVEPLEAALLLSRGESRTLRIGLPALLDRASRGFWSPEARLLYDLQKVGIDQKRDIHKIDLIEWALSLGKRPIKRLLPNHREVLKVRYLRSAEKRLEKVDLDEASRDRLARLLREVIQRAEDQLRTRFRPLIARTLERSGWAAKNVPERVALRKLTEELLDPIVDRGFLGMGELRDAISRNQLKLEDLSGPREFFRGDRLLRTDRRMGYALDGVYRRGEVYLRGLQRLSSLAFGTRFGRQFTRYVALPFGTAFVALKGLQHLVVEMILGRFGIHAEIDQWPYIVGLGVFLLALINIASFRARAAKLALWILRAIRFVFHDAPAWLLKTPLMRTILASRTFDLTYRWGIKPLIAGLFVSLIFYVTGEAGRRGAMYAGSAVFLTVAVLLNVRVGRDLEELAVDRALRAWQRLRIDILPGLFRLVMETFEKATELVERIIYTIDEKLRFKTGQSRASLASKAVLGAFWFYITYAVRIYINLLIEPQINPIKHFPVVTVSHKIILPLSGHLIRILRVPFLPLGFYTANAIAAANVLLLPGVFGFLVWELKENWRLYAANRSEKLAPVLVGHHGETIARFLRPGIHSGTLPKLFAKLRKAESHAAADLTHARVRKYQDKLHHAAEEIRHFVDRELLALLRENPTFAHVEVTTGEIRLGSNRIRITLERSDRSAQGVTLAFEEQSGWLLGSVPDPGWLADLTEAELNTFATFLTGFYKLAGVDLVREQVAAALGTAPRAYDISDEGLVVWPDQRFETEVIYDLHNGPIIHPRSTGGPNHLPLLETDRLVFSRRALAWRRWVDACDAEAAATDPLGGTQLMPKIEHAPTHRRRHGNGHGGHA